jgi:hypothetical protein
MNHQNDPLDPATGMLHALGLALILWATIAAIVWSVTN